MRKGLVSTLEEGWPHYLLLFLSMWWLLSLLLVPYLIPADSLNLGENGRANAVDFPDKWNNMPPYPKLIYFIGDFNCHQKASRTFFLNGNEMPVCARDMGIFFGAAMGFLLTFNLKGSEWFSHGFLRAFRTQRLVSLGKRVGTLKLSLIVTAVFVAPLLIDGFMQLFTSYESTDPLRFVTGALAGMVVASWFSAIIASGLYVARQRKRIK